MLVQEVILENFMSYEYARVPFKSGVNVICGPNGAGKSSLLLAISVALGQSYTERSKKLSNLVRWGKDQARVTLVLDNSKRGGKRPVPRYSKDQLFLTRVIRKDGNYWFELENRAATKQDVERLLGRLGVDPDNMLIIMHQNMVEQFTVLSNIDKLRMVEAAVGLEPFRENVLQAQRKLTRILSQEESVGKLLESAESTLSFWREQYEKYQEKKQLQTRRRFLDRELAWAEVERKESLATALETSRDREQKNLSRIDTNMETELGNLQNQQKQQQGLKQEARTVFNERLNLERGMAENESAVSLFRELLKETQILEAQIQTNRDFKLLRSENLRDLVEASKGNIQKLDSQVKENQSRLQGLEESTEKASSQATEHRIQLALLEFQRESASAQLESIESSLKDAKANIATVAAKAEMLGP